MRLECTVTHTSSGVGSARPNLAVTVREKVSTAGSDGAVKVGATAPWDRHVPSLGVFIGTVPMILLWILLPQVWTNVPGRSRLFCALEPTLLLYGR